MSDGPTLDGAATTALDAQFADLRSRLHDEFGADRSASVDRLFEQERDRFATARVRAFVPILMERSVRSCMAALDSA